MGQPSCLFECGFLETYFVVGLAAGSFQKIKGLTLTPNSRALIGRTHTKRIHNVQKWSFGVGLRALRIEPGYSAYAGYGNFHGLGSPISFPRQKHPSPPKRGPWG